MTDKNKDKNGQFCVVVPTTGGLVWVKGLKKRPRLKSSYAIMSGDFRPLKLSKDYHHFVSGPLTLIEDPAQIYELSLSENIDSGRSWEFPTLLAHLLEQQEALAFPDQDRLFDADDPGFDLVWATGMLDPDLTPIAADYKLARKLELSRPLFKKCKQHGRQIRIFLSADLPADERQMFKDAAAKYDADYMEISSLKQLTQALGVAGSSLHQAQPEISLAAPLRAGNRSNDLSGKPWLLPMAVIGGIGALAFWMLFSLYGPGSSIQTKDPESNKIEERFAFTLEQLTASNRRTCRQNIMSARRFDTLPLPLDQNDRFNLNSFAGLCGLRVRNTGRTSLTLRLSKGLEDYAIAGSKSLFQGRELRAGKTTDLYLSRQPSDMTAQLTVTQGEVRKSRFFIKFTRSTPDG